MKRTAVVLIAISFLFVEKGIAQGQLQPPSPGMSVVYFVRNSNMGMAINFTYLDSAQLIGRFAGPAYIRYECKPGRHLFWARSENRDFVEAELAPDQIYFIQALVAMGAVKAQVDLVPINPKTDTKEMERMMRLLNKQSGVTFSDAKMTSDRSELAPVIDRGLKTYLEEQDRGVTHDVLPAEWVYGR